MNRREPLVRNFPSASARLPHTTTLCHSVRSWRTLFQSRYVSEVARRSFNTACPPLVILSSGSAPRFPSNMTRFRPSAIGTPPNWNGNGWHVNARHRRVKPTQERISPSAAVIRRELGPPPQAGPPHRFWSRGHRELCSRPASGAPSLGFAAVAISQSGADLQRLTERAPAFSSGAARAAQLPHPSVRIRKSPTARQRRRASFLASAGGCALRAIRHFQPRALELSQ